MRRARRCAARPAHPKHQSSWREIRCRNAAAISRTQTIQSSSVVVSTLGLPAQTPALSERDNGINSLDRCLVSLKATKLTACTPPWGGEQEGEGKSSLPGQRQGELSVIPGRSRSRFQGRHSRACKAFCQCMVGLPPSSGLTCSVRL